MFEYFNRYPDVSIEELQSGDNVCIICREEMTTGCKKLPCGHIFHTNCLRSWFQRQQTCPTCRMEVLQMPQPRPTPPPPQQIHPQPQQQQQQPMMPNSECRVTLNLMLNAITVYQTTTYVRHIQIQGICRPQFKCG